MLKQSGFNFEQDENGNIINITETPKETDPNDQMRKDIETAFLERTKASLAGELPVDPGLIRDLNQSDQELENKLRKQFGDLTSSPAQEALQRAKDSRNILLDQARRGDLSLAEQLGQNRQNSNQQLIDSGISRAFGIAGANNFASQWGQAGQSAGNAMQSFQFNRNMQFDANKFNASQVNPLMSMAGTVGGAALGAYTGGLGAAHGAKLFGKVATDTACWVAREVYGASNPRWELFREWLFTKSPKWFFNAYITYGERFALMIKNKPRVKSVIKYFMEKAING